MKKTLNDGVELIKFDSAKEMLEYIQSGHDLYCMENNGYVFAYNEDGAICSFVISPDKVEELRKSKLSWSNSLTTGGYVYCPDSEDGETPMDLCAHFMKMGYMWEDVSVRTDKQISDDPANNVFQFKMEDVEENLKYLKSDKIPAPKPTNDDMSFNRDWTKDEILAAVNANCYLEFYKHEDLRALCINDEETESETRNWNELIYVVPTDWLKSFCREKFNVIDIDKFLREAYTSDDSEIIFAAALKERKIVVVDFVY